MLKLDDQHILPSSEKQSIAPSSQDLKSLVSRVKKKTKQKTTFKITRRVCVYMGGVGGGGEGGR